MLIYQDRVKEVKKIFTKIIFSRVIVMPLKKYFDTKSFSFLILVFVFVLSHQELHGQAIAKASGLWSAGTTWVSGAPPTANQDVTIPFGYVVTLDILTPVIDDITINGQLDIAASATASLVYDNSLTINSNGVLRNYGGIECLGNNAAFTMGAFATYLHSPKNNTLLDESIFTKSNEIFDTRSNLIIYRWFDFSVPLGDATRVQASDFGNVTLGVPSPGSAWLQNGKFMSPLIVGRIKGSLTVSDGTIVMDDGTGNTSTLYLQDVNITGTGNIIFQSGQSRPLTLFTGNFTDNSTSTLPTILMDSCFNLLIWTVTGNVTIGHNFIGIRGTGIEGGSDARITVNGNLTINGGSFNFIQKSQSDLDINVALTTTISGNPSNVIFMETDNGFFKFKTRDLVISGGANNVFMGGNTSGFKSPSGQLTFDVTNDFTVSGTSTTTLLKADTNLNKLRLNITRDLIINGLNSTTTVAYSKGATTLSVGRNFSMTNGKFVVQADTNNSVVDSVIVGLDYSMNTVTAADYFRGNYGKGNLIFRTLGNFSILNSGKLLGQGFEGIYNGKGNMTFTVGGIYTLTNGRFCGIYNSKAWVATGSLIINITGAANINNGTFRGIDNRYKSNTGTITFTSNSLNFNGGNFNAFQTVNYSLGSGNFTIANNCTFNFLAVADTAMFIGHSVISPDNNSLTLNLTVGGNLTCSGVAGNFISSIGNASEFINVNGNMVLSGGKNSFNSVQNSPIANAHKVIMTVNGNMQVTGGVSYLSAFNDSLTATVNGNLSITAGELAVQGGNAYGRLNVKGGYNQSGGTFYVHRNAVNPAFNLVDVTINSDSNAVGDFVHSGGTINFDDNTSGPALTFYIKSPNVTLGAAGSITRANAGTGTVFGNINYRYPGIINFTRSGTHSIQQVRQKVDGTTYFNVVTGDIQVASYVNGPLWDLFSVVNTATLDMHTFQIKSNALKAWSGIQIAGRLKTQRVQGLYDGTTNATISSVGNMYYWLQTNSTVEYNGVDNQIVTGSNIGTAVGAYVSLCRYYNLDINFNGTPDVEFVYPTDLPDGKSVVIRNRLTLTKGEFNLDNDHDSADGGRLIILTKGNYDMLQRTNGYIRSEVVDGSSMVKWNIGTTNQPHIIPFGRSSTLYIPFTFERTSAGNIDTLAVATYHVPFDNYPYPPPVTQLWDMIGNDNTPFTVDRFWYIKTGGTATTANMVFVATPQEVGSIANLRAQRWLDLPTNAAWEYPYQGVQTSFATGTTVTGATGFDNNWWTLASLASPLPVELTSFTGHCEKGNAVLNWMTQSETNNSHFTVLKSIDGNSYDEIGQVQGAGTVSTTNNYEFTDRDPLTEKITYYKLGQTDFDGRNTVYDPIAVSSCESAHGATLKAYSINSSELQVLLNADEAATYNFKLFDLQGKEILNTEKQIQSGFNSFILNHRELSEGIYLLNAESVNNSFTQKISILRGN